MHDLVKGVFLYADGGGVGGEAVGGRVNGCSLDQEVVAGGQQELQDCAGGIGSANSVSDDRPDVQRPARPRGMRTYLDDDDEDILVVSDDFPDVDVHQGGACQQIARVAVRQGAPGGRQHAGDVVDGPDGEVRRHGVLGDDGVPLIVRQVKQGDVEHDAPFLGLGRVPGPTVRGGSKPGMSGEAERSSLLSTRALP
ncbi:hypothetical protein ABZ897_50870 [Nonomuraea sp. NPDC046802]|uniref:hypothetical protein n=1 Tax=Nonomuraea sp. NPDC046802 TaxID=3154919 RepID=UPI0033DB8A7A